VPDGVRWWIDGPGEDDGAFDREAEDDADGEVVLGSDGAPTGRGNASDT
jgi:hypothetical protein